jgi:hypothetical protein
MLSKFNRTTGYISLAEKSTHYCDFISACFSSERDLTFDDESSILSCSTRISFKGFDLKEMNDWVRMEGIYQARGGEKYLTISLFKEDMNVSEYKRALKDNKLRNPNDMEDISAYYYIDNISVIEI